MEDSILEYLLSRHNGLKPEPVATELLVYLLQNHKPCKEKFNEFITKITEGNIQNLKDFAAEDYQKDRSRLDVTAYDADDDLSVVIEAKFQARLDETQIHVYYDKLADNKHGALLYLVPKRRFKEIKEKIEKIMKKEKNVDLNFVNSNDHQLYYAQIKNAVMPGRTVGIVSWNHLLNQINNNEKVSDITSDINQFTRFIKKEDEAGFEPITEEDKQNFEKMRETSYNTRREVVRRLNLAGIISIDGLRFSNDKVHRYFSIKFGNEFVSFCSLCCEDTLWKRSEKKHALWLCINEAVYAKNPKYFQDKVKQYNTEWARTAKSTLKYYLSIHLKEDEDYNVVVDDVEKQIKKIQKMYEVVP